MELTDIINIVVKKYNIDCLGLFGSRARNDHNEYSDYDLFIIAPIDLDTELTLESELETLLNAPVDLIRLSTDTDIILPFHKFRFQVLHLFNILPLRL